MRNAPRVRLMLTGFLMVLGSVSPAFSQTTPYSPEQMVDPRLAPKHDDAAVPVPSAEELKTCTVVAVPGAGGKSAGFALLNAAKQPLRRFFDSKGAGNIDVWSYFKDGVEVYREFDTAGKGSPNNFRWLNAGGMKWGSGSVGRDGKAVITTWHMISAEEAAFEAFQAIAKNDFARLHALLINDQEMQLAKLPAAKMTTIAAGQKLAQKKFSDLVQEANLAAVKFDGVESAVPQCDTSSDDILIKHPSRAIRYLSAKKEHAWIHTGEMVQVGRAWRLVDVPSAKDPVGPVIPGNVAQQQPNGNPQLEKAQTRLAAVDTEAQKLPPAQIYGMNKQIDAHYRERIELVKQIITLDKEDQRETWYKQLFDNLAAMAQNSGDQATVAMLHQFKDQVVKNMPGSNLAAYGTYRALWTDYALELNKTPPPNQAAIIKLQEKWLNDLTTFVTKYNKAEDTPEALHQLAIGCEFNGKTEQAKGWYKQLYEHFSNHGLAPRARGSEARLNLIGQPIALSGPRLADGKDFDIAVLKGKVVIVHYWASYSEQYLTDFATLKRLLGQAAAKQSVELVCINLDDDAAKAKAAVAKAQAPGIHLFQANNNAAGLSSPLANQYGIHILPTLFMVNAQGRVTNNAMQVSDVEAELRKLEK